jgi:hypothetical protein
MDTSRQWQPYEGGEVLVFQNEQAEELQFALPSSNNWKEDGMMVVDVPCSKGSFLFPKEQLVFYEVEDYNLFLTSDTRQAYSLIYHLRVYQLDDLPGQDTLLIDYLEATAQFGQSVANLYLATSTRLNPAIDSASLQGFNDARFIGDTTLLGRPFSEVYVSSQSSSTPPSRAYFSPRTGFVAIEEGSTLWVLDRIE